MISAVPFVLSAAVLVLAELRPLTYICCTERGFRIASWLGRHDPRGHRRRGQIEHPRQVLRSKATAIDQPARHFLQLYGKQRLGTSAST